MFGIESGDEADTAPAEWIWTEDLQPKSVPNGIKFHDEPQIEDSPVALEKAENERLWDTILQSIAR